MKLVKSTYNKVITGVCGGIGKFFRIDPTIVRVLFAVAAVFTGIFPLSILYIILSFIIPNDDFEEF